MQEILREVGLIPGLGRSAEGRHGNPLHYSCLENPMDRGAWGATVHAIPKSWTQLSDFPFFTSTKVKHTPAFKDLVEIEDCETFQS